MTVLVGLFKRKPKDPEQKKNLEKFKEIKKLIKEKKYEDALKAGKRFLDKVPSHHDVLFIVGGIYYMNKKYKTAIYYFDRALEIGSYDVEVLLLKAQSHEKLGDAKQVRQCCDKIVEVDPKNKTVSELLLRLNHS